MHGGVSLPDIVSRGGWAVDGVQKVFTYITQNVSGDTRCARALSDWPNSNEGGLLPNISCINEEDRNIFRKYCLELFGCASSYFNEGMMVALTITLLRFHEQFMEDYPDHLLVTRMNECSSNVGVSDEKINEWALTVVKAFASLNVLSMNVNELGEDTTIPAGRIIEYMEQTSRVYRQLPVMTASLHGIERSIERSFRNMEQRMSRMEREIDLIKVQTQQHQVTTNVRTDTVVRATPDTVVRRTRPVEIIVSNFLPP